MVKPKLVIFRGKVACGKTTALYRLKKNKKFKDWIIIDNSLIKSQFENLGDDKRKEFGKIALFSILKSVMPKGLNILMDEMSEKLLRKSINHSIKKYKYDIVTFEFTASVESSIKREADRRKIRGLKPRGAKWVEDMHKWHIERIDPNGIIVDCDLLDERAVEKFIIEELK
ncbi:MAG: hypothetical protein ACI83O_000260 [Patescibacteria group bacterium]|jgi:hypothetical protein